MTYQGVPLADPPRFDDTHPRGPGGVDTELFTARYLRPIAEETNRNGRILQAARPISVRYSGPLGGVRVIHDPDQLRAEAHRMLDVAATLEELQKADEQ